MISEAVEAMLGGSTRDGQRTSATAEHVAKHFELGLEDRASQFTLIDLSERVIARAGTGLQGQPISLLLELRSSSRGHPPRSGFSSSSPSWISKWAWLST
jgi:hypothetical protein